MKGARDEPYDTYGTIQLKVGSVKLNSYDVGDSVPLPDGVYMAPDGVVIILGGKLVATFEKITSKWGDLLDPNDILRLLKLRPIDMIPSLLGFE